MWFISDGDVYRASSYITTAFEHGFDLVTSETFTRLSTDGNNGDTVVATWNTNAVYLLTAGITSKKVNLPSGVNTEGAVMLSGTVGWVWTDEGEVYFTNNKFSTLSHETVKGEGGADDVIIGMFRSSDKKTVYAFSKSSTGLVRLCRY